MRKRRKSTQDLTIRKKEIDSFLAELKEEGASTTTLEKYRFDLTAFCEYLHPAQRVERDTLRCWQQELLDKGCAVRTVNSRLAAANSLLNHLDRRDLQFMGYLAPPKDDQPELTREEYLRLLETARDLGKERTYLLIKLFAAVDLPLQDLPMVTVEAVRTGRLEPKENGSPAQTLLPTFLREELLAYARRSGVVSGPLFLGRGGEPLKRGTVTDSIKRICQQAGVDKEKGTPRCLHRMRQSALNEIRAHVDQLVADQYLARMKAEQALIAWK